jgi:hypothetical protein
MKNVQVNVNRSESAKESNLSQPFAAIWNAAQSVVEAAADARANARQHRVEYVNG